MTPLVRRYIKTSFIFLIAGLLLGGVIIVNQFVLNAYPPRTLRAACEIAGGFSAAPALRYGIALGGLGQLAGAGLFVLNMWTRVRMPKAL